MTRYVPPAIKDEGLDNYLDRTRNAHSDRGSVEFRTLLSAHVSLNSIAKAFNVSRNTVVRWVQISEEEADNEVERLGNV